MSHEAHLSAEQDRAEAAPWFPGADGNRGGAQGAGASPRTRPQKTVRLIDTTAAPPPAERKRTLARLKKRADFLRAARGIRRVTPGVTLEMCAMAEGTEGIRVGFTASRKVGGAVERNRARRRLRAAAQAVLPLYGLPGNDYVLVARRETVTRPFEGLVSDLKSALAAAHARLGRSQPGDVQ